MGEGLEHDELDALLRHHFKYGMSRFELGQFLIQLGCKVDLTKFRHQLLQGRERSIQHGEEHDAGPAADLVLAQCGRELDGGRDATSTQTWWLRPVPYA